jgi:hypothetical protein
MNYIALAILAGIAGPVLANLPKESREPTLAPKLIEENLAPDAPKIEDDRCGLVTITVKLRIGETWQAAEARAKKAANVWKLANPGTPIDFESTARAYAGKNRVHSVIRHLSYGCGCPPPLLPVPPPKKP